jgi:hypothetical protein
MFCEVGFDVKEEGNTEEATLRLTREIQIKTAVSR